MPKIKLTIYWVTRNRAYMDRIREKFGIPRYMSVNRETPCMIDEEDMDLLEETARLGFIEIRKKK